MVGLIGRAAARAQHGSALPKGAERYVRYTHDWLGEVPDFDAIKSWAAGHHEKLDGSGYSFGKSGPALDFNARLVACIDIYQAVSERRPYHEARSHAETMPILRQMAAQGLIDGQIVRDLDEVMAEYSGREVPSTLDETICG